MKFAIHFDSELTLHEIVKVFTEAGYVVRCDAAGRTVASRVPTFLRTQAPATNVVPMPRAKIRGAR